MKGNVINLNTLHLNSVRLNGIGKVQSVSLKGGSTEDPVFPPVEPPIEPEPTPTYTLSASVTNGMVSAKRNGSAVNLPYTANEGDVIVVEVTPNDGYEFNGWNDGNTDNPRSITMNADVALSAQCVEVVQPPVGNYIQFEDKAVEAICVANWSSDGIGLTEEDAAKVTSIGTVFTGNTEITTFNEFRYFTGVTSLSFAAFSGCSNFATIDLSNITEIKAEAFRNCTELSIEVIIPNVANILKQTFVNTKITKLVAENIVTIESSAFGSCANLKEVDLGISVQSIGWGAFSGCSALESVVVRATTPPSLAAEAFKFSTCPIYVSDASLEAYKTATNWNQYADRIHPLSEIEGDNGVIKYDGLVGAYTFKGRSNEDADYDLVQDRSGNGNIMTIYWGNFGQKHPYEPLLGNGYWDDMLWMYDYSYGKITLPTGLTQFTVIAKRFQYISYAGNTWAPQVGTGEIAGKGLFWLEYNDGSGKDISNVNGKEFSVDTTESEIVWMNNTYYNGHLLVGTEGDNIHDGRIYLNKFRGDVNSAGFLRMTCLYIFNRELTPTEIESFIKAHIDADYVLPTIEQ